MLDDTIYPAVSYTHLDVYKRQDTDSLTHTLANKLLAVMREEQQDPLVGMLNHKEKVDLVPVSYTHLDKTVAGNEGGSGRPSEGWNSRGVSSLLTVWRLPIAFRGVEDKLKCLSLIHI